jgi:HAD superfamily hydrolase (TIGR01458 family)
VTAQLVLLDLDGTLYEKGEPIPGAAEAVIRLRSAGHTLRFFTNTDSKATDALLDRLRGLGFAIGADELFTPVVAARRILGGTRAPRALLLVSAAVAGELGTVCDVLPLEQADQASHVIIGDYRDGLSYPALDAAYQAVHGGAQLVALQTGRYFRAQDGPHLDTGAIVAAVEYAAEAKATVLGKPAPEFLGQAIASVPGDFAPAVTWVVGDDRSTDIAMAVRAGVHSVQPRTGKYGDQAGRRDLPDPEYVVGTVAELPELLAGDIP